MSIGTGISKMIAPGKKPTVPDLPVVDLSQQQLGAIGDNQKALPEAGKLASATNAFNATELQKLMAQAFPFFNQMLGKASESTMALLRGEVPADVAGAVSRASNARAVGGGFGGSGAGRALTLRDLGRTSLNAQQQGLSNFGSLTQLTQAVMPRPFDVTSMFMTPLQRATWTNDQNVQQFQRNWMKNQIDASPDPFMVGVGDTVGGLVDAVVSYYSAGMVKPGKGRTEGGSSNSSGGFGGGGALGGFGSGGGGDGGGLGLGGMV